MGLFEMKKIAFENAVQECSKRLDRTQPPNVSITETPCPLSSGDEIAHIHPYERIICIWKKKLESLNLDEIREVAAHEVAHLVSLDHDGKHAQAQAELEIGIWRPPPGVIVVNGNKEVPLAGPDKEYPPEKNVCSCYLCKKRIDLHECKYCGKKFCTKHLPPKNPSLPPFKGKKEELEEWRKIGHACLDYRT